MDEAALYRAQRWLNSGGNRQQREEALDEIRLLRQQGYSSDRLVRKMQREHPGWQKSTVEAAIRHESVIRAARKQVAAGATPPRPLAGLLGVEDYTRNQERSQRSGYHNEIARVDYVDPETQEMRRVVIRIRIPNDKRRQHKFNVVVAALSQLLGQTTSPLLQSLVNALGSARMNFTREE